MQRRATWIAGLTAAALSTVAACSSDVDRPVTASPLRTTAVHSAPPSVLPPAASPPGTASSAETVSTGSPARSPTGNVPASAPATGADRGSTGGTVPAPVITGRTIVLNPGHNGANAAHPDVINVPVPSGFGQSRACDTTGTNTNAGYPEHEFNWDVTQRVKNLLQARGVKVILTRPNDTGIGPCIDERARIGNQAGVTAVVSIHADGAPTDGHGFHICEDSRAPAGPTVAALSHRLTVAVHDSLVDGSGLTTSTYLGNNGYYPRSDLAGLNLATVPATFIELGNMRNAGDAALQSSTPARQRMAVAIATGILGWLG